MNVNKEKIGALFIMAFSIAYGIYAFKIPLIFLSQGEALNARTMPYALSIAGIVISLLIIILPSFDKDKVTSVRQALGGLDWRRTAWLTGLMLVYSLIMPWDHLHGRRYHDPWRAELQGHSDRLCPPGHCSLVPFDEGSGHVHCAG